MIKVNLWKTLLIVLCTGCFITGCGDDDDNPFVGVDNNILTFSVEKGESVWKAQIVENDIILTVPSGTELKDAKANYTLSEQAQINPNPADISTWNEEQQFVVTSYNGNSRTYKYTINYSDVNEIGTMTINSQTEMNNFVQQGITIVEGSLYIGTQSNEEDPLTDISGLLQLKEVLYTLQIGESYPDENLSALSNLEKTGDLTISSKSLKDVSLPKLIAIRQSLSISGNQIISIKCPSLKQILKNHEIKNASVLTGINFNSLQSIGGDMTTYNCPAIVNIEYPALETVEGNISYDQSSTIKRIEYPALSSLKGNFSISSATALEIIKTPNLKRIEGRLSLISCKAFTALDDMIKDILYIKEIKIQTTPVTALNVKGKDIESLIINNSQPFTLTGDETFKTLEVWYQLPTFVGITKLQNFTVLIGGSITCDELTEITGTLSFKQGQGTGYASEVHMSNLTVLGEINAESFPSLKVYDFPQLEQMTDLTISLDVTDDLSKIELPKLKTITGTLKIGRGGFKNNTGVTNLDCLENLETIGNVSITNLTKLYSFTPLKQAFDNSITESSQWTTTGCGYPVTFEQMKAGETEIEAPSN